MGRNSEVLFSTLPSINIQRSILDIPYDHKTTFNSGELIPFYCSECLPSDSVKIRTNKVIRLQTLLAPIMSQAVLDTFYFFIPNRLLWSHWKEFMGENTGSAYLPEVSYRVPYFKVGYSVGANESGSILDYLGIPLTPAGATSWSAVSQLPLRAYWLCWNEFFRDQNLQDPINVPLSDSDIEWKDLDAALKKPLPVNRLHDYFSSALKAPAKNAAGFVTAWSSQIGSTNKTIPGADMPAVVTGDVRGTDSSKPGVHVAAKSSSYSKGWLVGKTVDSSVYAVLDDSVTGTSTSTKQFDNLYADLSNTYFGITIPDIRQAFQMQKFLERDASHGTRYQEQLLSHFSVKAQDARLQRPEYLGGNRIPINVMQIVNQAQSSGEPLGDVGAMSLTTDSHFDVEYSVQEHGWILGLCCVRWKSSFSQGFNKQFGKFNKFDFAFPEFAHLTDQPIRNYELYDDLSDTDYSNGIFGYAERYAEYKFKPDTVSGEMRPGITNSLASWHLGDYYTDQVFLSDEWMRVDKANLDRTLAVTSAVSNQIFADFFCECRWTRPLPVHSNPGFADHF